MSSRAWTQIERWWPCEGPFNENFPKLHWITIVNSDFVENQFNTNLEISESHVLTRPVFWKKFLYSSDVSFYIRCMKF